jgi:hypothetical protein
MGPGVNADPLEVLHDKCTATFRRLMVPAHLVSRWGKDHDLCRVAEFFARRAPMPGKSIVMAVVLSGWLIAAVIAFMIVAYASFFGIAVVGLMIWFVSTRVDMEQEGPVGVGVSPGFFAGQVRRKAEMSHAERAAVRGEKSLEAQSARFFRHLGIALTLIGAGGFLYFQL